MALASLCSNTAALAGNRPSFTAFIVDHRLRKGSEIEAEKVARVLKQMKIETQILQLQWDGVKHQNVETMARRLRFQALGRACRDRGINSLLLAHHGDDQAETVLGRLINGYTGLGFRGIKAEANIPECYGIYGVHESGLPKHLVPTRLGTASAPFLIEHGGVRVHRPLLEFQKAQLIATCNENGVKWFEDPTNADKGLTPRNTIRHMWAENRLPAALSPSAMIQVAQRVEDRATDREGAAESLFNNCTIEFGMQSGTLDVVFPSDIRERLFAASVGTVSIEEASYRAALLLRRILSIATPMPAIALQDLQPLSEMIFPFLSTDAAESATRTRNSVSLAGLLVRRLVPKPGTLQTYENIDLRLMQIWSESRLRSKGPSPATTDPRIGDAPLAFRIERETVATAQWNRFRHALITPQTQRAASIDFTWSNWHLFDGRFWLRIRYRPFNLTPNHVIRVRFLKKSDLEILRDSLSKYDVQQLESRLKQCAPAHVRFTLPVITEYRKVAGSNGAIVHKEDVRALPTLGWSVPGWRMWKGDDEAAVPWRWECRYKMIEFGKGKAHSIKLSPLDVPRGSAAIGNSPVSKLKALLG